MQNVSAKELNAEIDRRYGNAAELMAKIRGWMKQHGIKQSDLSRVSGYNPSHICRWLSTKPTTQVVPNLETRMNLAEAVEELISEAIAGNE